MSKELPILVPILWHKIETDLLKQGPYPVWQKLLQEQRVIVKQNQQQILQLLQEIFEQIQLKYKTQSRLFQGIFSKILHCCFQKSSQVNRSNFYMIYGNPGTGKTTLLKLLQDCIVSLMEENKNNVFKIIHYDNFTYQSENVQKKPVFLNSLNGLKVLCIDEYPITVDPGSDTSFSHILHLISQYYPQLKVIITSNTHYLRQIKNLTVQSFNLGMKPNTDNIQSFHNQKDDSRNKIELKSAQTFFAKICFKNYVYQSGDYLKLNGWYGKELTQGVKVFGLEYNEFIQQEFYFASLYPFVDKFELILLYAFEQRRSSIELRRFQSLVDTAEYLGHRIVLSENSFKLDTKNQKNNTQFDALTIYSVKQVSELIHPDHSNQTFNHSLQRTVSRLKYMSH